MLTLTVLSAAACDNKSDITAPVAVTLSITPDPASVVVNGVQQFRAVSKDANGDTVTIIPTWSVVAGGGTINSTGLFTAGAAPGTFTSTVKVTAGNLSALATVIVTPGPIASIVVTPSPVTLGINATQQFTAVAKDALGNVVTFVPAWTVAAGGGTIDNAGTFTAGSTTGTFTNTVTATSGAIAGNATVIVTPGALATVTVTPNPASLQIGAAQQFVATGRDAAGNIVVITPTWTVAAGGGTISTAGLFTAGQTVGTFTNTVQATSGGISGAATVNVTGGPVATVVVTPNPVTLATNATQQFTAVAKDASGNIVAIAPVWSVANSGGAISATGLFTAGATPGTFSNTVRATSGTISGSATVTVTPQIGALATITVTPDPANLAPLATQQFTAVGRDANGQVVNITPVWSVTANGGTITPAGGLFTAGAANGTFTNTVRATSGLIFGSATVVVATVTPPAGVNLGSAGTYGILAGTDITCVTGGIINADVGVSPGNTLTGFPPCTVSGQKNLGNAAAAQAQIDLTTAYNTLAGMACPPANVIVANLGGTTKPAGVYCAASAISVSGTLTLDGGGDPNAVFVFQAGSSLTTAGNIVLIGGAQAKNVYWQVGSSATIGTGSAWQGNILALSSISLIDNATLNGRALARNGKVSLTVGNIINLP
jgi:hypothetical protein